MAKLFKKKDSANSGKQTAVVGKNSSKFKLPKLFKSPTKEPLMSGSQMGGAPTQPVVKAPSKTKKTKSFNVGSKAKKLIPLGVTVLLVVGAGVYILNWYQKQAELNRAEATKVSLQAQKLVNEGKFEEGIKQLDDYLRNNAVKDKGQKAQMYYTKSSLEINYVQKVDDGIASILTAIESNPKEPWYYLMASQAYLANNNIAQAKEYSQKALEVYDAKRSKNPDEYPREYYEQRVIQGDFVQ